MRIGVCIPCHAPHLKYLAACIASIEQQTLKPEVISISVSSFSLQTPTEVEVPKIECSIPILWSTTTKNLCAAANRNRAAARIADHVEILSFFDADDAMFPSRIEQIQKHFTEQPIDFLLHETQRMLKQPEIPEQPPLTQECFTSNFEVGRDSVAGRVWQVDSAKQKHLGTCGHVSARTKTWKQKPFVENQGPGEDSETIYRWVSQGFGKAGQTPDCLSVYFDYSAVQEISKLTNHSIKVENEQVYRIPFPYAIPDEIIVPDVPQKECMWSDLVPGGPINQKFGLGQESEQQKHYQAARFANTKKKEGWDCLRHQEILANGCIPNFEGLIHCPTLCLTSFPKNIVKAAMKELLPWKETPESILKQNGYVRRLLAHMREQCTTSALARKFCVHFPQLLKNGMPNPEKKILLLLCDPYENQSRDLFQIGIERIFGANLIDSPKNHVVQNTSSMKGKYGNGFTQGGRLEDIPKNRENIEARIQAHEFDVIIQGKVGPDEGPMGTMTGMPQWSLVQKFQTRDEIAFLQGGDYCQSMMFHHYRQTKHLIAHEPQAKCFVRELDDPTNPYCDEAP